MKPMKHLLITFSLLGILFLSGCDEFKKEEKETISFNDIVKTKNIYLKKFTQEPFTGFIETYYESGRLKETGEMIYGRKVNSWITYTDSVEHHKSKEEYFENDIYVLADYYENSNDMHRSLIRYEDDIYFVKLLKNKMISYYMVLDNTRSGFLDFSSTKNEKLLVPSLLCELRFDYKKNLIVQTNFYTEENIKTTRILRKIKSDKLSTTTYKFKEYGKKRIWKKNKIIKEEKLDIDYKKLDKKKMKNFANSCKYKMKGYTSLTSEEKEQLYDDFITKKIVDINSEDRKVYRGDYLSFTNEKYLYEGISDLLEQLEKPKE